MSSYFDMDHAAWVKSHTGKEPSALGARVAYIIGVAGGGIYNAPINVDKVNWQDEYTIKANWYGDMATWDFNQLTLLLCLCHHYCIRMSLRGSGPGYISMMFHQRKARDGSMSERHPEMDEAWASIKAKLSVASVDRTGAK